MPAHVLTRLDINIIPSDINEIRVFGLMHNELTRLPYYLEYYRKRGVSRFFFVDHKSTDGTLEFLLEQSDCHVFHTQNSYAEAASGISWTNTLLNMFGTGQWCLIADADELLVYPHAETVSLPQFCTFLDQEGADSLFTFLLDMYPKDGLEKAVCVPGKPFIEICSNFDRDYSFVDRIHLKGDKPFPEKEVIGGPRVRCFFGDQGATSKARRLFMHIVERGSWKIRKMGLPIPFIRLKGTPLFKMPLIKWKKGYAYTASTHELNQRIELSSISGALLHFKFFADFHQKAIDAVNNGQHAQGSIEYRQYLKHIGKIGNLVYSGTTEYRSSDDLIKTGLIKTTDQYDQFVSDQKFSNWYHPSPSGVETTRPEWTVPAKARK